MKRSLPLFAGTLALLLVAGTRVRADLISAGPPVKFTYNWSPITTDATGKTTLGPTNVFADSGQAWVHFTDEPNNLVSPPSFVTTSTKVDPFHVPDTTLANAYQWLRDPSTRNAPYNAKDAGGDYILPVLGTNAPVSTLTTGLAKGASGSQLFTNKPFHLALVLTEWDPDPSDPSKYILHPAAKPLVFDGAINSSFSPGRSNLSITFDPKDTFQTTTIQGNTYYVQLAGWTAPGSPTANQPGSIASYITVVPSGTGSIAGVPEPSTLVLSWLGLSFLGAAGWRKRRQVLPA